MREEKATASVWSERLSLAYAESKLRCFELIFFYIGMFPYKKITSQMSSDLRNC